MTMELPVLRLGLAGFTAEQQEALDRMLATAAGEATTWEIADLEAADALWVNGARTQVVGPGRIRVAPGVPSGRSLQFDMTDIDRPMAFATPLPGDFQALCSFDPDSGESMAAALQQLESWLSPLVAQFCLASHIAEHQSALGPGEYELRLNSQLLAIVDMQGQSAVRSTARPQDFDAGAMWQRCHGVRVPQNFVSTSLSQLMWQYTTRTQRDLLPPHYRTGLLYFRRAPRLPPAYLKDSHLLLMRELMLQPATFAELQKRCATDDELMARDLASLYFVGSITSNPKRAAPLPPVDSEGVEPPSHLNFDAPATETAPKRRPVADLTVPAPLRADH
jgi:hypothetical protein